MESAVCGGGASLASCSVFDVCFGSNSTQAPSPGPCFVLGATRIFGIGSGGISRCAAGCPTGTVRGFRCAERFGAADHETLWGKFYRNRPEPAADTSAARPATEAHPGNHA